MVFLRRIPPSGAGRKSAPPVGSPDTEGGQKKADGGSPATAGAPPACLPPAESSASEGFQKRASGLPLGTVAIPSACSPPAGSSADERGHPHPLQADCDQRPSGAATGEEDLRVMLSVLADAGCTLCASGPPLLPADSHEFRSRLERRFAPARGFPEKDNPILDQFLSGMSSYISSSQNLRRILIPAAREGLSGANGMASEAESLARMLLLMAPLQPRLQHLLLERLPEFFDGVDVVVQASRSSSAVDDDIARLIVNQFRWLDFVVDPEGLSEKLMQVLSICPLPLKREIIGSLPELLGDCSNCGGVVEALEGMLQEDSELVVPILDAFSNLNFTGSQLDQVVTVALSCIRTVDAEHLPDLLRFLLISADKGNVGRIVFHIREQLKFISIPDSFASRHKKLKGKYIADGTEASILEALRCSLRFRNVLCEAIFKELKGLNQPRDYKAIDVWLLVLIHTNGGSPQKSVEKILKRKILDGCIQESLFDQCIQGQKNLVKEYFSSFISFSEFLLACAEEKPRNFGIHLYTSLFGEFNDSFSRQEVLSSLVTHVGSGVSVEVSSALDVMALLASKYSAELVPLSSHVNGILDYLEGFNDENLREVYEVFCQLSFCCPINADSTRSSIAHELLILVRKQLGNPDMRYRKMGIIGTSKIVSNLGDVNSSANVREALEFLRVSFDSCKQEASALILLYDELSALVQHVQLQPSIMEWMGMHLGDFESVFVTDLEGGQLLSADSYFSLEGEPWMNLDGDTSIICLNILPMLFASFEQNGQPTIRTLPAQFQLLTIVERSTNHGSLEGIDALLGCPLHLPSKKHIDGSAWNSLTEMQKKIIIFSLYYAMNWMRELLNAFSTQVAAGSECVTQSLREETVEKLLKRLRNILFLESLLNCLLKLHPLSLPKLHFHADMSSALPTNHAWSIEENEGRVNKLENASSNKKRMHKKNLNAADNSGNLRQPTIIDTFERAGVLERQELSVKPSSTVSCSDKTSQRGERKESCPDPLGVIEMSAVPTVLYAQESKFRVLHADCLSILSLSKRIERPCCSDPTAELCSHLYLLRELHRKFDRLCPLSKQCKSSSYVEARHGHPEMSATGFLGKIKPLFPSLRKHLDDAIPLLTNSNAACKEHWKVEHASAENLDLPCLMLSNASVCSFVCQEVLSCCGKIMNVREVFTQTSVPLLKELLRALQPSSRLDDFAHLSLIAGNMDYLYCGAYSFVEGVLNTACPNSSKVASEALITLESLVKSIPKFLKLLEENGKNTSTTFNEEVLPLLQRKLGTSAHKLLAYDWATDNHENPWKNKGALLPRIIRIYLRNAESRWQVLAGLACSIFPQVTSKEETSTFIVWYRTLHEENIAALENSVKGIASSNSTSSSLVLEELLQSVHVVVSLVHVCKTHPKVSVHALAVKYGGKFVDVFIKAFDFLEAHFHLHNDSIIRMVKELQKATRTIQILCSEAKRGAKRTMVSSRVPAAKRSLERFLFRVKAMLHNTSNGSSFWMGNLKHKDLLGQVVSSQLCDIEESARDVSERSEQEDETE